MCSNIYRGVPINCKPFMIKFVRSKIKKKGELEMENTWYHKSYQIKDGLKPGSLQFQYFYVVSEQGNTRCHYCVWITDEALPLLDGSRNFDAIVSSRRESWNQWVKENIDQGMLESKVLKIDPNGASEVALADMPDHFKL